MNTSGDSKKKKNNEEIVTFKIFSNVIFLTIGLFIFSNSYQLGEALFPYLNYTEFMFSFFGTIMIGIPTTQAIMIFLKNNTKNLSSIDDSASSKSASFKDLNYQKKESIISPNDNLSGVILENKKLEDGNLSFQIYFTNIINKLESKAFDSDKKASLLLDNGKYYSVIGIFYFIVATILWQLFLTYVSEFKNHHIYGIISTSLVFIFIEFLSAWYLRQYKSFSDTATYLTKIKSIFDKYMLIYLVSVEKGDKDFSILLEQLSSEIKWPETYLLKNADVNFAKEAIETMTTMAQAFKNEVKNKEAA